MPVAGAAFGDRQVVPAAALVKMWTFRQTVRASGKDLADLAFQAFGFRPFLQEDTVEGRMARMPADGI